jgi:adenylate cyclase
LEQAIEVTELLPPLAASDGFTDEHIAEYEAALQDFVAGRWQAAFERLHRVPATDRVKDFLTVMIAQHNRHPPAGWDGVISLTSK